MQNIKNSFKTLGMITHANLHWQRFTLLNPRKCLEKFSRTGRRFTVEMFVGFFSKNTARRGAF